MQKPTRVAQSRLISILRCIHDQSSMRRHTNIRKHVFCTRFQDQKPISPEWPHFSDGGLFTQSIKPISSEWPHFSDGSLFTKIGREFMQAKQNIVSFHYAWVNNGTQGNKKKWISNVIMAIKGVPCMVEKISRRH